MPTQAKRTEATRGGLVAVARRLFAEQGFAATSTEEILDAASVSRGAMYHHFSSKAELFRAAFEAVEDDLTAEVLTAAAAETDPMRQLSRGFASFLEQCRRTEVQRIVMVDGPTVLGWDTWHELDERYAFGSLKAVLAAAADQGRITPESVDSWANLLLGALMQAGMVVARAEDPEEAKRSMTGTFEQILTAIPPRAP